MKYLHGGDVYRNQVRIDFSININPLGMPESVVEAGKKGIELATRYPDTQCMRLREELESSENVSKEYIFCGNGAAELIFLICLVCKPKKALLLSPTFAEYEQGLKSIDSQIEYYELDEKQDFQLQEDYLTYLTDEVDMVFLCNPNNPTGQMIEHTFLVRILETCKTHNIYVVIDECFLDFLEVVEKYTMKTYIMEYKNLIILKAFTKLYSMPGMRLGYGFTSNSFILQRLKEVSQPWSVSVPAMEAGIAALKEKKYVEKSRKLIFQEREFLTHALQQGLVKKLYQSSANYILFQAQKDLGILLMTQGIMIRDCSNYRGLSKGYFRIAIRDHRENEELIQIWKRIVKEEVRND